MEEILSKPRHSLAHVLAQAVQRSVDPLIQLGTGPAIEHGFYYDILFAAGSELKEADLADLQKTMDTIVKEGQRFGQYTAKNKAEAIDIVNMLKQSFKLELIEKFYEANPDTTYTFYYNYVDAQMLPRLEKNCNAAYITQCNSLTDYFTTLDQSIVGKLITFVDLCEGGHVDSLADIPQGSFALEKIAGAYRQAKEGNPMMTRIYGLAFATKQELKEYQTMMEEAKKRDHRILGKQLKLFTLSELVGSGLPLFQPKGMIVRQELEKYLRELHKDHGYARVWTPHIAKEDLYNTSGHAKHYLDDMFKVHGGTSDEDFYLKPMNCPHHMQLFADNQFSYRDMPIRYFEPATVYRDEKTGQLSGLTRVRSITQDDGHLFCRITQLKDEIALIVKIIKEFYKTMGMLDGYRVSLSVRGEEKEKYLGGEEVWATAEGALRDICAELDLNYREIPGEAAFYGPKLDFMFKDAIGRQHQLATVQVDFNLPERFDLSFVNESGDNERPVVIHRAISGSLERFMGVMIEHFAGAFPLWLAPEQIKIIPVVGAFGTYADEVMQHLKNAGLRVSVDEVDNSLGKKIRNAELEKIPYIVVVGEKEVASNSLSIREYKTKNQYEIGVAEFVEKCIQENKNRSL